MYQNFLKVDPLSTNRLQRIIFIGEESNTGILFHQREKILFKQLLSCRLQMLSIRQVQNFVVWSTHHQLTEVNPLPDDKF